jgi:hypothetical protein
MAAETNGRIDIFKWAITIIVTLVLGLSTMNAVLLTNIRNTQSVQASELVRLKAIQDVNTASILLLSNRVTTIELNRIDEIKTWVELNFQKKDDKK